MAMLTCPSASEALAGKIKLNASHRERNAAPEIILMSPQSEFWCINRVLYVAQVFGGRVQENALLPVARQPDGLQSRLFILHYMENYAKFQVNFLRYSCHHNLEQYYCACAYLYKYLFVFRQGLSAAGRPWVYALPAGPPPQGAPV